MPRFHLGHTGFLPPTLSVRLLMSPATADQLSLRLVFGRNPPAFFDAGVPVLAGGAKDDLFAPAQPAGQIGALALFRQDEWLVGAASVDPGPDLARVTHQLYLDLFRATRRRHLARIWSYVPGINDPGATGLENYRAFCQGRALAFEQTLGAAFKSLVPAASAVGTGSPTLTVAFAASLAAPRHVENPLQTPAYDYPPEYGPRSPSFARATLAPTGDTTAVFVSGTAAIRGHATVAPANLAGQLDCTLENLREISRACGLGPDLDRGGRSTRHFRVYVRHAADQPRVAATLNQHLFGPRDRVCYLQADICRKPLLLEIEATLLGVALEAPSSKPQAPEKIQSQNYQPRRST